MRLALTAVLLLVLAPAVLAAESDTTEAGPTARQPARLSAPT